jgi:hypothetical protein
MRRIQIISDFSENPSATFATLTCSKEIRPQKFDSDAVQAFPRTAGPNAFPAVRDLKQH